MSALLDASARRDPERSQALDRNDKQMADNLPAIFRLALAPFAPPPITQAEWEAADLAEDQNKPARRHAVSDASAVEADTQWLDVIRRTGW